MAQLEAVHIMMTAPGSELCPGTKSFGELANLPKSNVPPIMPELGSSALPNGDKFYFTRDTAKPTLCTNKVLEWGLDRQIPDYATYLVGNDYRNLGTYRVDVFETGLSRPTISIFHVIVEAPLVGSADTSGGSYTATTPLEEIRSFESALPRKYTSITKPWCLVGATPDRIANACSNLLYLGTNITEKDPVQAYREILSRLDSEMISIPEVGVTVHYLPVLLVLALLSTGLACSLTSNVRQATLLIGSHRTEPWVPMEDFADESRLPAAFVFEKFLSVGFVYLSTVFVMVAGPLLFVGGTYTSIDDSDQYYKVLGLVLCAIGLVESIDCTANVRLLMAGAKKRYLETPAEPTIALAGTHNDSAAGVEAVGSLLDPNEVVAENSYEKVTDITEPTDDRSDEDEVIVFDNRFDDIIGQYAPSFREPDLDEDDFLPTDLLRNKEVSMEANLTHDDKPRDTSTVEGPVSVEVHHLHPEEPSDSVENAPVEAI